MFTVTCCVCGRTSPPLELTLDIIRLAVLGWSDDTCPDHPRAWVATRAENDVSEYLARTRARHPALVGREGHA